MAGRVEGKVAFVTGAARGQGRSHALRLAEEGADIVALDLEDQVGSVPYQMSTPGDMAQTVKEIEALDRRIVATQADVRDYKAVKKALDSGVAELGHVDIVSANAGIFSFGPVADLTETQWQDVIDINLTGVWHTCKAVIPHLIEQGTGGSIILTSSVAGLKGSPNTGHYSASKHGVVGLMRTLALELAPHFIRVNSVHPTTVDTPMIQNDGIYQLFRPDLEHPTQGDTADTFASVNALPIPWVDSVDISNAVLFLASDEARYITGARLPIDAGATLK
jgi:SDR family mycofactocin-dependent oxidoreductase